MVIIFIWLGAMGTVASFFLPWFEGSWGNDYCFETYGVEGLLDTLLLWIRIGAIIAFIIGIVLFFAAKKLEPKKERITV
jgi:hypothetical protein